MTNQYDAVAVPANKGLQNGEWESPFDAGDPPLFDAQLRAGAELALSHAVPLFLTGADTDLTHLETEARNYLVRLRKICSELPLDELKIVLEEDARTTTGNVFWTFAKFGAAFGFYPRKVGFVGFPFKEVMFLCAADHLGLADRIEFIGVADPAPGPRLATARAGAAAKASAMGGDWRAWRVDHQSRNPRNIPVSIFLDPEVDRFARYVFADGPPVPVPSWSWRVV
jgi:hypothetical protein